MKYLIFWTSIARVTAFVISPQTLREAVASTATTTKRSGHNFLAASIDSIEVATKVMAEWDRSANPDQISITTISLSTTGGPSSGTSITKNDLRQAVLLLNEAARIERNADPTKGQCLLGICAPSARDGVAALKSWVSTLELPRGLLHGMDKDGMPLELNGGVYIKYNSGGVFTFADIRKSGLGFDSLWKPGDAMLEEYDGTYRGVYFQVQLLDGEFRQFLVPLNLWDECS